MANHPGVDRVAVDFHVPQEVQYVSLRSRSQTQRLAPLTLNLLYFRRHNFDQFLFKQRALGHAPTV